MHGNIGLEDRQSRTLFWFEVPLPEVSVTSVVAPSRPAGGQAQAESKHDAGSGRASLLMSQRTLIVEDIGNQIHLPVSSESDNGTLGAPVPSTSAKSRKRSLRDSSSSKQSIPVLAEASSNNQQVWQFRL